MRKRNLWRHWCNSNTTVCGAVIMGASPICLPDMESRNIFKSYDVRGNFPKEVNEESIRLIARALTEIFDSGKVIVAHDGRHGSVLLANTVVDELKKKYEIIFVGLSTTPMFYFLVNHFKASGGAMITASHNPKQDNGVKAVRAGAVPISGTELLEIIDKQSAR